MYTCSQRFNNNAGLHRVTKGTSFQEKQNLIAAAENKYDNRDQSVHQSRLMCVLYCEYESINGNCLI